MPTTPRKASPSKAAAKTDDRRINLAERLASARAARAEGQGDAPVLSIAPGVDVTLPREMPYEFARVGGEGDLHAAFSILFGGDQAAVDALFGLGLSVEDIEVVIEDINALYGVTAGK